MEEKDRSKANEKVNKTKKSKNVQPSTILLMVSLLLAVVLIVMLLVMLIKLDDNK